MGRSGCCDNGVERFRELQETQVKVRRHQYDLAPRSLRPQGGEYLVEIRGNLSDDNGTLLLVTGEVEAALPYEGDEVVVAYVEGDRADMAWMVMQEDDSRGRF